MQRAAQSLISIMRIRSRMMCEILSNRCESGEKKKWLWRTIVVDSYL